jgi:hypothetical protein
MCSLVFVKGAEAAIVDCGTQPTTCYSVFNPSTIGGSNPYVWVTDAGAKPSSNYFDPASPTQIDYHFTNLLAGEHAIGSLATGVLGVYASTTSNNFDSVGVQANDIYTIEGPASIGPIPITASVIVSGAASLTLQPFSAGFVGGGSVSLELCGPGGAFACNFDYFNLGGLPFPGYIGPIYSQYTGKNYLQVVYNFTEPVATPFNVYYSLSAQVNSFGLSFIDVLDPVQLSFTLPPGYSVTSQSGFSSASATPEPGTALYLGIGLACLTAARCGRRHRSSSRAGR